MCTWLASTHLLVVPRHASVGASDERHRVSERLDYVQLLMAFDIAFRVPK